MTGVIGGTLFATICNTVREATPFSLWVSGGGRQYVLDLSDHLATAGGLTGIAYHNGLIYLAVQSGAPRILVLDMSLRVVDTITHESFNDLHSLYVMDDSLIIVSPRSGAVLRRHFEGRETVWLARFDPRAWVCAVLRTVDHDLWFCCHDLSYLDPAAKGGGVFSVRDRRAIVDGLERPHSLMRYREGFVVLDSANARVVFFDRDSRRQFVGLEGFLRGAVAVGAGSLLVAGGPDRTISRKNPRGDGERGLRDVRRHRLKIFEVNQTGIARIHLPELPGYQVYDLFVLPEGLAPAPSPERIVEVEPGMFARFYYTALVTAHARETASVTK